MREFFDKLLSGEYAPHGYCLLWQPELIWTHVVSDALIAMSYFSIPIALVSFVRRRRDVAFGNMFWLFALFILACGSSHLMAIWNLWHGNYGAEAVVKAVTAIASVPTAMLLWPLIPRALAIPSPTQLQLANEELAGLVRERDAALEKLRAEIEQREHAEEALTQARKIDAIGQLTGGIAHDFNNLLQAITGNLELIRQRADDPERVARWSEQALHGVERGTRLTHQMLAFSRVQRMELRPVDVNALIGGMRELIQRSLTPTIRLDTHLQSGGAPVLADRTQLELALLNLAINARDAMPEGGRLVIQTRELDISAEAELDIQPGRYVELSVSDTGTGMSPEVARRALEPFFTTKGVGKGTGLGLSMAFGVARQCGGTLHIRTEAGQGTTIIVLLPRTQEAVATPVADQKPASVDELPMRAPRENLTVMLIDDDRDVRTSMAATLEEFGYHCVSFDGGLAAIAAFTRTRPDLIVLDFAMPDMNGAEAARHLRAMAPEIPIVFVSGFSDSAALDAVLDSRSTLLRKPFRADALARLVYQRTRQLAE